MPTGFTAAVQNGEISDFAAFALRCARAFGATIDMRDDPADATIPDEFQPSRNYGKWAAEERAKLARLEAMTPEEIVAARDAAEARRAAEFAENDAERADWLSRYEAMLESAKAWEPPTPEHVGMKQFMIKQLEESIRFDCGKPEWLSTPLPPAPEWFAEEYRRAAEMADRCDRMQREEDERTASRNSWIKALRLSLTKAAQ